MVLAGLLFSACSAPEGRAQQRRAAFARLLPADQKLVLQGRVRVGMSKEAVHVAWGEPSRQVESGAAKEAAVDTWIYVRQISVYAPLGSSDGVYPPPGVALHLRPGFGYGGAADTGFLYSPRVVIAERRVKRAEFVDGRLRLFETRRSGR